MDKVQVKEEAFSEDEYSLGSEACSDERSDTINENLVDISQIKVEDIEVKAHTVLKTIKNGPYGVGNFECDHCKKKFRYKKNHKRHLKLHTGLRPFMCAECGRCFTEEGKHRQHVITVHTMSFLKDILPPGTTEDEVEAAIQGIIEEQRKIPREKTPCSICNRLFPSISVLRTHIIDSHREEMFEKLKSSKIKSPCYLHCPICGQKFASNRVYNQHQKSLCQGSFTGFTCPFCNKMSKQRRHHNAHVMTLHTFSFFANQLPPGTTKAKLEDTIKKVISEGGSSPEKKSKRYGCPSCSRGFPRPFNLRTHILEKHFQKVVDSLRVNLKNESKC